MDFVVNIIEQVKDAERVRDKKETCILTVPTVLLGESTKFYYPQMVSIGPFHNHDQQKGNDELLSAAEKERRKQLQGMKMDKLVGTERFWKLQHNSSQDSAEFDEIKELCEKKIEVRDKYDRDLSHLLENELAEMCFVDVAFVLEFLNSHLLGVSRVRPGVPQCKGWHSGDSVDPIFKEQSNNLVHFTILMDVLKLENQLPMVVLKKAMSAAHKQDGILKLEDLLYHLCDRISPITSQSPWTENPSRPQLTDCKHILDCLHLTLVAGNPSTSSGGKRTVRACVQGCLDPIMNFCSAGNPYEKEKSWYLPCSAGKMKKGGVEFKAMGEVEKGGIKNVRFDAKSGTLYLPKIDVGVWTETIFRNLLAYEACYTRDDGEKAEDEDAILVTRFVLLMSQLVENEEDANLLRVTNIIQNNLGDNKKLAQLWNDISGPRWIPESPLYDDLTRHLNVYLAQHWIALFAEFWEQNCSKPWLVWVLILAIITFPGTLISIWSSLKAQF